MAQRDPSYWTGLLIWALMFILGVVAWLFLLGLLVVILAS